MLALENTDSTSASSFEDEYFKLPVSLYETIFLEEDGRFKEALDDILNRKIPPML